MRAKRIEGTPEERFWPKVAVMGMDECWLWQASFRTDGYGVFGYQRGHLVAAHRFAYVLTHGEIPDGLWVLHRCDVKACVNPAHLFLGTVQDNADDMVAKRRHWAHIGKEVALKGEANGNARLSEDQVREIRSRHAAGESALSLTRDFPVSHPMIRNIVHRRNWKHVA